MLRWSKKSQERLMRLYKAPLSLVYQQLRDAEARHFGGEQGWQVSPRQRLHFVPPLLVENGEMILPGSFFSPFSTGAGGAKQSQRNGETCHHWLQA
jgi:hypothetical protein